MAALANEYDLELCHFDVDQDFVRADLKEDVFMRLPKGCGALSAKIVKLNKSLLWFEAGVEAVVCNVEEVSFGFGV